MQTSGTFNFSPSVATICWEALENIGRSPTQVTREQLASAQRSFNLELIDWANAGWNQWKLISGTISLTPGIATYTLQADVESIVSMWYSQIIGPAPGGLPTSPAGLAPGTLWNDFGMVAVTAGGVWPPVGLPLGVYAYNGGAVTVVAAPDLPTSYVGLPSGSFWNNGQLLSVTPGSPNSFSTDRILTPITREQYAQLPNKLQLGIPTQFFPQMQSPSILVTLYQNPQLGAPTYVVNWYALQRMQDAALAMGQGPDVHYRALSALCARLSVRLARKFAPERLADAKEVAAEAWALFANRDSEMGAMRLTPMISAYGRI
jgi:hypothetical protein